MKDILQDKSLRQMPYDTPEGYFEGLKAGMKMIPTQEKTIPWRKFAGIAAAVAILLTAGGVIAGVLSGRAEFSEEDYIVFSDEMTNAIYQESYTEQYATAQQLTEEELIEYLIYTDVEIEEIEEL